MKVEVTSKPSNHHEENPPYRAMWQGSGPNPRA